MMFSKSHIAGIAFAALLAPAIAGAHAIGQSFEKTVGEYLVDVGYDSLNVTEGQDVRFDASLISEPGSLRWEYAPYDQVWLQLSNGSAEPFRAVLPAKQPGPVYVNYRFPSGGSYVLSVRFLAEGKSLADASFRMKVTPREAQEAVTKNTALSLFALFLFAVIGIVAYRRYAPRAAAQPAAVQRPKRRHPSRKR